MKNVETFYPLSPMQQGLLFHSLFAPESGVYVEQISCTLDVDLNVPAFQRAWQEVVQRHPVLRTSFIAQGLKEPVQAVHKNVSIEWEEEDWSSVSAEDVSERLEAFLLAQRQRGFRLSHPPLLRFALLRLGSREYRFIWCWHHLLLDGWSLPLLFSEVFALYAGGSAAALVERRPYRDFVAWVRARERGGAGAAAEVYWREALRGFSTPTSLRGLERRGGSRAGERQAEVVARLGEGTSAALLGAARARGLTLNATVQGAWALTLMRVSGAEDVVFGAVVSGRGGGLEGIERMVGLFINTLAVRARVKRWSEGAWEWLRRLQDEQVEAREHEQVGLVEVAGWSEVGRGVGLFETLLAFENYPVDESVQETRLAFEIEEIKTSIPINYPLTMTVVPGPDMILRLAYDAGRFDELAVNELLHEFRTALRFLATHEDAELGELNNLLNDEKRERRSAAEEDLKQMRGLKFRTVRRAGVTTESVQVARSIAED